MELSLQENTQKMMQTKKDVSETAISHSDDNLNMERISCCSASANNLIHSTRMTDKNRLKCKRYLISEDQMRCKKQKGTTETNLKGKPFTTSEGMSQESEIAENQSMFNENLPDVINMVSQDFKLQNQPENSGIMTLNVYPFISQSIPPNPLTRKIIFLSKSILYPGMPGFSTKAKTLGFKTIHVGGLPQKIAEGIIKEIFERCDSLEAIRMPEKNVCYISFSEESSFERVMCFSDNRLKINYKNEGILQVDYAEAEFDHERRKLQNEDTFYEGLCKLREWLKQRKCSKDASVNLFSLMQHIYFHVHYLVEKKNQFEQDVTKLKSDIVEHIKEASKLLVKIEDIFKLSQEQNNLHYFTKKQNKFIALWGKHSKEWKNQFIEDLASYETSFEQQKNQPKEIIEFCRESEVLNYDLEDSEGRNEDDYFGTITPFNTSFLCEKLKIEEKFSEVMSIVMMWLEKEEYTNSFFTIMQCIHNHVIKLHNYKSKFEDQLKNAKGTLAELLKKIMCNLTKIGRIYTTILQQKCFDNFTLPQRESIELWRNYAEGLRSDIKEKIDEFDRKVEVNDKHIKYFKQLEVKIQKLQESKNNLQQQCKEVQNKITTVQSDYKKDLKVTDEKIAAVQNGIRNSQKEVLKLKNHCFMNEIQIKELYKITDKKKNEHDLAYSSHTIPEDEARIIAFASVFLQLWHGATIDSICNYLHEIDSAFNSGIVENTLRKYPTVFHEDIIGDGAHLMKNWYFVGFQT